MAEMNLFQKLQAIQTELVAPKNLFNSFGKYNYRNAESICEALKPFEAKYKVATTISDKIEIVGDRVYVTATVTLHDVESDASISVSASAREALDKKGMDEAQITGATSSYARKYALGGMFLLDDTKDVDSEEYQAQEKQVTAKVEAPKAETPKVASKKAPAKKSAPVEQFPNRNQYIKLCKQYDYNIANINKELGLDRNSTDDKFVDAITYVENLHKKDAKNDIADSMFDDIMSVMGGDPDEPMEI